MAESSEHGNEPPGFIKGGTFLNQVCGHQILKKGSVLVRLLLKIKIRCDRRGTKQFAQSRLPRDEPSCIGYDCVVLLVPTPPSLQLISLRSILVLSSHRISILSSVSFERRFPLQFYMQCFSTRLSYMISPPKPPRLNRIYNRAIKRPSLSLCTAHVHHICSSNFLNPFNLRSFSTLIKKEKWAVAQNCTRVRFQAMARHGMGREDGEER